eukprot:GHVR01120252.1.p1 GENE.GHVR01120252.1~~GHVR01120252.1.p1  ORF type:complete len:223 (+),score=65.05 GHVR01120252.1:231-899(+)
MVIDEGAIVLGQFKWNYNSLLLSCKVKQYIQKNYQFNLVCRIVGYLVCGVPPQQLFLIQRWRWRYISDSVTYTDCVDTSRPCSSWGVGVHMDDIIDVLSKSDAPDKWMEIYASNCIPVTYSSPYIIRPILCSSIVPTEQHNKVEGTVISVGPCHRVENSLYWFFLLKDCQITPHKDPSMSPPSNTHTHTHTHTHHRENTRVLVFQGGRNCGRKCCCQLYKRV